MPKWAAVSLVALGVIASAALCVLAAVAVAGLDQARATSDQVCAVARQLAASPAVHVTVPASCGR